MAWGSWRRSFRRLLLRHLDMLGWSGAWLDWSRRGRIQGVWVAGPNFWRRQSRRFSFGRWCSRPFGWGSALATEACSVALRFRQWGKGP